MLIWKFPVNVWDSIGSRFQSELGDWPKCKFPRKQLSIPLSNTFEKPHLNQGYKKSRGVFKTVCFWRYVLEENYCHALKVPPNSKSTVTPKKWSPTGRSLREPQRGALQFWANPGMILDTCLRNLEIPICGYLSLAALWVEKRGEKECGLPGGCCWLCKSLHFFLTTVNSNWNMKPRE